MRDPQQDIQLARFALQLLGRASVQMNELDIAVAVRNWLVEMAEPRSQSTFMNGAEMRPPDQPVPGA